MDTLMIGPNLWNLSINRTLMPDFEDLKALNDSKSFACLSITLTLQNEDYSSTTFLDFLINYFFIVILEHP